MSAQLTPALLTLMEHEKNIEQGQVAMLDMAYSFEFIREEKMYQAAGFKSFGAYCHERWDLTRRHVDQVIEAGRLVKEMRTTVLIPTHESQVRPLKALPPNDRAAAWEDAVNDADGEQPTAKQVKDAVQRRQPPKPEHPARFSDPILEQAAAHLRETGQTGLVLDPFAGTGRVHELRERAGVSTIGVELEQEWADKHEDTRQGNALELTDTIEPDSIDAIVTSPTYGNRMADHHNATDDSTRLTYKHTLGRDLSEGNSGAMQWGDEYRSFHEKAWVEAVTVLKPGGTLTLNIKNHIRAGVVQRVVEWHTDTLYALGLHLIALDIVPTKGLPAGENSEVRTLAEYVMTFRKDAA